MKMKKLLVAALAVIFILGTVSTGFAAVSNVPEDVEGTKYEDAVTRLSALGIVGGYPDGTFKAENTITRAEFAKIMVTAVGVGNAAEYAKGVTKFNDVPASYWASGYINVASDMGIINGYPDVTFKPAKEVSYAEAITMIIRALGYEPKAKALGGYPGGYLAVAAEKGITDDVNVVGSLPATRGDVALMVDNSLTVDLMEQTGYGTETVFEEVDKTLLEDKLDTIKYEGVVVTSIPRFNKNLNEDEIELTGNFDDDDADETEVFEVLADVNIDSLFGMKADVYVNDDDEIFFFDFSDDFKVYYDEVDADGPDSDVAGAIDNDSNGEDGEITLIKADDDFELVNEDEMVVYLYDSSGDLKSGSSIDDYDELESYLNNGGIFGKFVVNDDNEIQYMELYDWSEVDAGVVTEVDEDHETITYFLSDDDEEEFDLADEDGYKIFNTSFNEMALEDVEANDVIYIQKLDHESLNDTLFYVFVVDQDVVEGELDKYDEGDNQIEVDDEEYDVGRIATISIDDNDTIIDTNDADFWSDVDDALGEEVIVVFDLVGDVRHISTEAEASSDDLYGLVIGTNTEFDDEFVKIFTQDGEEVVYKLDLDNSLDDFNDVDAIVSEDGSNGDINTAVVKYTLDSDGEIDTIEILADLDADTPETIDADGIDSDSLDTDSEYYLVNDDVIIFDLEEYCSSVDTDDIDIITWDSINNKDADGSEEVFVDDDSKDVAKALFFVSGIQNIGDDEFAGYAIDVKTTSDGDKVEVDVFGEGIKEYYLKTDDSVNDEEILLFTLNADDELIVETDNIDPGEEYEDYDTVSGYVYEKDGDYIKFADDMNGTNVTNWYKIVSDTVIYDEDDVKDKYDIDEGDQIENVLVENRTIKVIKID